MLRRYTFANPLYEDLFTRDTWDAFDELWDRDKHVLLEAWKGNYRTKIKHYTKRLKDIRNESQLLRSLYRLSHICLCVKFYEDVRRLSEIYLDIVKKASYSVRIEERLNVLESLSIYYYK